MNMPDTDIHSGFDTPLDELRRHGLMRPLWLMSAPATAFPTARYVSG
jgi:hypothetical protein